MAALSTGQKEGAIPEIRISADLIVETKKHVVFIINQAVTFG